MKVKWLGHASMLLTSEDGIRVITDPYEPGVFGLDYGPITESADVVTVSHDHADHNRVAAVRGNPDVIKGNGTHQAKGIEFRGIGSHHDTSAGKERGPNTIFCFSLDGIRVCHLGDLGHALDSDTQAQIRPVDVLLTPVGGNFTIDAKIALETCRALEPKVVIPMHYCNDRCPQFPVAKVNEFLKLVDNVKDVKASEVELMPNSLPQHMEVMVLKSAL